MLWYTLASLKIPAPTFVFPGRVGVERVQQYLQTLRNLDSRLLPSVVTSSTISEAAASWQSVPV